jgi:hypothetical protein
METCFREFFSFRGIPKDGSVGLVRLTANKTLYVSVPGRSSGHVHHQNAEPEFERSENLTNAELELVLDQRAKLFPGF